MAPTPNVEDLTQQAPLVFQGTVVSTGTTTMESFPAAAGTAVVRIDEIIRAPQAMRRYAGREITVQLRPRTRTAAGDQALFFVEGLVYGDGLAVRELGRRPAAQASGRMRARVAETVASQPDVRLQNRVDSAALVVTGRVAEITPVPTAARTAISEHDPDWHRATVDVESVEKGNFDGGRVQVVYAASRDVAWYDAPKLNTLDRGVFLLQRGAETDAAGRLAEVAASDDFIVLDPLDFQPVNQRDRIQALTNLTDR